MTTTTYRNDTTGYRVTFTDFGRGEALVTDSLGYAFPMTGADYRHAGLLAHSRAKLNGAVLVPDAPAAQMTSPLAADAQVPASNLARGSSLTTLSDAAARAILEARAAQVDTLTRSKSTTLPMLQALVRRGHAEWTHRFRTVRVTAAGRIAADAWAGAQVGAK
jgi:hypothetical protein